MAKRAHHTPFPSQADLLGFLRSHPDQTTVGDIARAFGLKNEARAALRQQLRALEAEGLIETRKKRVHRAGALPSTVLADIVTRDSDGELVAVPAEWDEEHGPAPRIAILPAQRRNGPAPALHQRVLLRLDPDSDPQHPRARLLRVFEKSATRVVGIYRSLPQGGGRIEPVDKKQLGRELAVPPDFSNEAQDGDLVIAEIASRSRFGLPQARIREKLGSLKSERAVSMIAIASHDIPHVFPPRVLEEAEAARPATLTAREDWRDLPLVTIDPIDAKDHDDAVHAAPDPDHANRGGFILSIAIADVAHSVKPGSALDHEALKRGNSVYFPDRVVPMLPERISNDLCSLKVGEARGALAVRIVIGADGRKRRHSFHRVLMRSAAKLHYAQAQAAFDGMPDDTTAPLMESVLAPLLDAYDALARARDAREPLDLDLPERKILLKTDGTVDRVVTPPRLTAHRLIEEFMIAANVAAAETLEGAHIPLIWRVHDEPSLEKIHALHEFLATLGLSFPKGGALSAGLFNRVLAQIKGRDGETLVNEVVLRSQAQAEYAAENYGHFGLNLRRYAHFTSPIRRYADLVVHRGLIRAMGLGDGALPEAVTVPELAEIAADISVTERRASHAERETFDRLLAHFLADRVGAEFHGRISGVTRAGLFVKLDDTGADGFVPARTLGVEYFRHDEKRHAMVGERSGETYRLGDPVEVKLVEAAPVAGALRFQVISPGRLTARSGKRFAQRAREDAGSARPAARKTKRKAGPRPGKKIKHKTKGKTRG